MCSKWFHAECANLNDIFENYIDSSYSFLCSNKCELKSVLAIFPFSDISDASEIDEFNPFRDLFPCKICREECITDCIQCDVCDKWVHADCALLRKADFDNYAGSSKLYICSVRCELKLLPFSSSFGSIVANDFFPDPQLQSERHTVIDSQKETSSKRAKYSAWKKEKAKTFKSVYFDPFLDVKCSFKCPTELNDGFLSDASSCLGIFHNNVRSLNKNFHKVEEVFQEFKFSPYTSI